MTGALIPIGVALSGIATTLAVLVARRRRDHWPIAATLAVGLGVDVAQWVLRVLVVHPAYERFAGAPFTGWTRVGFHVYSALFLLYPAAVATMSVWVFMRRRPWVVGVLYGAAVVTLVAGYPGLRREALARMYRFCEMAAAVVILGAFLTWALQRGREKPNLTHACAMLIGGIEVGMLVGMYRINIFSGWDLAAAMYATLYVVLAFIEGGTLCSSSRESK